MRTVVHYLDSAAFGGTERIALSLLTGADRSRWRPVLFHRLGLGLATLLEEAARAGVELREVPCLESGPRLFRGAQLAGALRVERPAVFHAHLSAPQTCRLGLFAASLIRIPAVVAHVHLFMRPEPGRQGAPWRTISRGIDRQIAASIDRYVAVSDVVARRLRDE